VIGAVGYISLFLLVSLVVAVTTAAIHPGRTRQIGAEALRFFLTIVIGIFVFSVIVGVLEWVFIRPLL
jgi:hypothetical protein